MPAPTFDLPVFGSGAAKYSTEQSLESALTAFGLAIWNGILTNGGRFYTSRELAVSAGQAASPTEIGFIITRENNGSQLVVRGPLTNTDDPLFATSPYWGVTSRIDTAAAMRDAGVMTLANVAGTANAITAELPPAAKLNGVTSTSGTSIVEIVPTATNTAAPTLTIDGGGPVAIQSEMGAALEAGQLIAGRSYLLRRRGTVWRVISGGVAMADLAAVNATRAAVTDLRDTILRSGLNDGAGMTLATSVAVNVNIVGQTDLTASDRSLVRVKFAFDSPANMRLRLNGVVATDREVRDAAGAWYPAAKFKTGQEVTFLYQLASQKWTALENVGNSARLDAIEAAALGVSRKIWAPVTAVAGTGDAITGTLPAGVTYAVGDRISLTPLVANTGNVTLNGNQVRWIDGAQIPAGYLVPGRTYLIERTTAVGMWQVLSANLSRSEVTAIADASASSAFAVEAAARAAGDSAAAQALAGAVATLQQADQALSRQIAPTLLARGDTAIIAEIGGVPVISVGADGKARLVLDDWSKQQIGSIGGGGGGSVAFLKSDILGDGIDGWNVWQDGQIVKFTGVVWGTTPRAYLRRESGDVWADGPSRARLILTYGDELAASPIGRQAGRFANLATISDGFGQDGLNGVSTTAVAADIQRAGAGLGALVGDAWLSARGGTMPWIGVRSEAVEGATMATLGAGQPLQNLTRARTQFHNALALYARDEQVDAVVFMHGGDLSNSTYAADLIALTNSIRSATGAAAVVAFAPAGTYAVGGQPGVLSAPNAINMRGTTPLIIASPLYWCSITPGTQNTPTPDSMTMLAELAARALLAGMAWVPPMAFNAARSGTTINIDFDVMPGFDLVAPTEGLTWSGTGTIQSATVVADPLTGLMTRLRVTLSADSAGRIGYAVQATGSDPSKYAGRGNMRDTWSAQSVTGGTLRRYALPFAFEV